MRVRAGFVTNSSSTSFLLISRNELEEEAFLELMGVEPDSPIADLFRDLFHDIIQSSQCVDLAQVNNRMSPEAWFDDHRLSSAMTERLKLAAQKGGKAYFGELSSEDTLIQSFFCTDAFEVENDRIYFNCLDCVW